MKGVQPLLVVVADRSGRVQPFTDPDEGIEIPQLDRRRGQGVEPREEFSDILDRAVLLRRQFRPEGHGPAVRLYRLLHVDQANGQHVLPGEPTCDAHART